MRIFNPVRGLFQKWRWGAQLVAATLLILTYQNCSKSGFKAYTAAEMSSNSAMKTPLMAPQISLLSNLQPLSNIRNFDITLLVKYDPRLSLKSVTCQLNAQAAVDCKSLVLPMIALADNDYVLKINAEDSSGQKAPEYVANFRIDGTAPLVSVSTQPPATTGSTDAQFIFVVSDSLSGIDTIECQLDGGAWAACTSPKNYPGLSYMTHSLKIRARDKAGNTNSQFNYSWAISASAPALTISMKPNTFTNVETATFQFNGMNGSQPVASFECQMDNGGYSSCSSPKAFSFVPEGPHTFYLRGRALDGTWSAPVTASWTYDRTSPPDPTMTSNISGVTVGGLLFTKMTSAAIAFAANDSSGIMGYECSTDNVGYAPCTSPKNYSGLTGNSYLLYVKAKDNAGNTSLFPGIFHWLVDLDAPPPPMGLTATAVSSSQINLAWSASSDMSGISGYRIYRGGTLLTTVGNVTVYNNTGLNPSTTYSYTVEALDGVTNASGQSQAVNATTQAGTTPPPTGNGPSITNISGTFSNGSTITIAGAKMIQEDQTNWDPMFKNTKTSSFEGTSLINDGYGTSGCPKYTTAVKLMGNQSVNMHDEGQHIRQSDGSGLGSCNFQWDVQAARTGTTWTDVYLRTYSRWNNNSWPTIDTKYWWIAGGNNFAFFNIINDGTGNPPTQFGVYSQGGNGGWQNGNIPGGGIKNNRWYLMEARFRMQGSGNYIIEEWVDNVKILSVSQSVGVTPNGSGWGWESNTNYFNTPAGWISDQWQDGFAVSKTRVGPASLIEVSNSSTYGSGTLVYQEPVFLSETSSQVKLNLTGLGSGPYYIFVTNNKGERSPAFTAP